MVTVEITGVQDRSVHKSPKLEKTANVVTEINEGPTQRKGGGELAEQCGCAIYTLAKLRARIRETFRILSVFSLFSFLSFLYLYHCCSF